VLDDLAGEAAEVYQQNSWLTYAPQLHRLREFGIQNKVLDLLDERQLAPSEVRELLALLLGGGPLPHPEVELLDFLRSVEERQLGLPAVYNPVRRRATPWVDARRLRWAVEKRWAWCTVS